MVEAIISTSAVDLAGLSTASIFAALFFATFVSEDAACIAAGALAASGEIHLWTAIGSCFLGIVVGDFGLYWTGRLLGRRILELRLARKFVSANSLTRASEWLERGGAFVVFVSRFVTGLRLPTYIAAGFLKTSFAKFAGYFILAAALWTPILVGTVYLFNGRSSWIVIAGAISVFIAIRVVVKAANWKDRRIAIGKLRRIWRWEFWPLPIFYFPVVCYILLLAIRHRSLTVFTCANPAIPAGGFVGESKDQIYSLLGSSEENRRYLLRHAALRARQSVEDRLTAAEEFMTRNGLEFPVVVKPDAGERGRGVQIVENQQELHTVLASIDRDQIIQEFAAGPEVGIFYCRYPAKDTGEIFAITEKIFATVSGDGVSTLETLILRDERAVCLAESYLKENASRLMEIPGKGECVPIIEIGTHSRGAIFRDGNKLKTSDLERTIDAICRRVDGFNFGRFDIRYSSLEAFRNGKEFKIIELNGVTSEATNIYDPRYSLFDAYRILFRQWRLAFEIGKSNKRNGAAQTSPSSLLLSVLIAMLPSRS